MKTFPIDRIRYIRGFCDTPDEIPDGPKLERTEWTRPDIPPRVVKSLRNEEIFEFADLILGDENTGTPIQVDQIEIVTGKKTRILTVYNRAICLVQVDSEEIRRIHRFCEVLEQAAGGSPDYTRMTDDQIVRLLFTEEDTLPRAAADEIVRRGKAVVPRLAEIVTDEGSWDEPDEAFWAPVHATHLLGAIGGPEAVPPLLAALRSSHDLDVDWVYDTLPSILPRLGEPAVEPLRTIALDREEEEFVRIVAIGALEGIAQHLLKLQDGILTTLRSLLESVDEDEEVRGCAGASLLPFVRSVDRTLLERVAEAQKGLGIFGWLSPEIVQKAYREGPRPQPPDFDWMTFYDDAEIRKRQERWESEATSAPSARDHRGVHAWGDGEDDPPGFLSNETGTIAAPHVRPAPAVGRNAPCPCGSGKKFKKCCGVR